MSRIGGDAPAARTGPDSEVIERVASGGSTLAVVRRDGVLSLEIDGEWQGEARRTHQIVAAHAPMLLHEAPKRVCVVGLGVGNTARRFLMYPIERLDAVDLEAALPGLIRKHFDGDWLDDPRVRVITADGRAHLEKTREKYDVISLEVGQLTRPGVLSFYTREFYAAAAERMNAGGLLAQFLPVSYLPLPSLKRLLRAFIEVFPDAALWSNGVEPLLLGRAGAALKVHSGRLALLESDAAVRDDLEFSPWGSRPHRLNRPENFLASWLLGARGLAELAGDAAPLRDGEGALPLVAPGSGEAAETDIVAALRPLLDPLGSVAEGVPPDVVALAENERLANLDDLGAVPLFREAIAGAGSQDADRAIAAMRKFCESSRGNVAGRRMLADALVAHKRHAEALQWYDSLVSDDAEDAAAHAGRGSVLMSMGRQEEAFDAYSEAARLAPDDARIRNVVGALMQARGDLAGAAWHFEAAARLSPDDPKPRANWGTALAGLGRADEGILRLQEAVALDPGSADAHYNLAGVLMNAGRRQEAVEHFRKAVQARPGFAEALVNMALALRGLGRLGEAVQRLKEAAAARPGMIEATYNLGLVLAQQGHGDEALKYFRRALETNPGLYQAHDQIGAVLLNKGRTEDAMACFNEALRLKPSYEPARRNLEAATAKQGQSRT